MKASSEFFINLIAYEGLRLNAYLDSASVPTIGIGTIKYPNGKRVKMGDKCTKDQAIEYAKHDVDAFEDSLNKLIEGVYLKQNQFDAALLLMYNIGATAFAKSTVLKLIKNNPNDSKIEGAWLQWNKARVSGVLRPIKGLTNRRVGEYKLYSK